MKKNIEQEKAIAQLEGPVILISCPGSGKTTTLLRRINHMLKVGIPPEKILMITFTKAAAQEMSVKFKKKFGEPNGITFSTIHALCLKILMTYGGLSAENIIKTSDQWKFLLETARKCQSVCDPAKAAGYPYITGRGGRGKAAVLCCSHKGKGKIIYHLCREQKRQTGIPFRQGASAQGKRTG